MEAERAFLLICLLAAAAAASVDITLSSSQGRSRKALQPFLSHVHLIQCLYLSFNSTWEYAIIQKNMKKYNQCVSWFTDSMQDDHFDLSRLSHECRTNRSLATTTQNIQVTGEHVFLMKQKHPHKHTHEFALHHLTIESRCEVALNNQSNKETHERTTERTSDHWFDMPLVTRNTSTTAFHSTLRW